MLGVPFSTTDILVSGDCHYPLVEQCPFKSLVATYEHCHSMFIGLGVLPFGFDEVRIAIA